MRRHNRWLRGAVAVIAGGWTITVMPVSSALAGTLPSTDAPPMNGSGWVEVSNYLQLEYIDQNQSLYLTSKIELMNNIDLSGYSWVPFGDTTNSFTGTFNGQDYQIQNLSINDTTDSYVGFFGEVTGATIVNVGVTNATVAGGSVGTGGLVGNQVSGNIDNSYVTGSVNGSFAVGGLVGTQGNGSNINYSYATGSVSGGRYYNGGLVGVQATLGNISYSYATASVTGTGTSYNGGLLGALNGSISNTYATGSVSGGSYDGGLVGLQTGSISTSYFDVATTGQPTGTGSTGGTGSATPVATDSAMKTSSTYVNWDFSNTWAIASSSNNGYPYIFQIQTSTLPQGKINQTYVGDTLVAFNGAGGTLTWSATGLPTGMSLSSSGILSGTPTQSGTFQVTINATDMVNSTAKTTLTLTINPSNNADLSSLTLSTGTLTPAFASGTTSYTEDVGNSVTSVQITPTLADSNATMTVNAVVATNGQAVNVPLNVGDNTITVVVTAQDGITAKTYTVTVTRATAAPGGLSHSSVTSTGWQENWLPVAGASSFNVYLDGKQVGSTTNTVYTFSGQQPGTSYTVTIASVNGAGLVGSVSGQDQVTTLYNATWVPTDLQHSDVTTTGWNETWTPVTGTSVGTVTYNVYLNGNQVGTTSSTSYSFTGLSSGTTYTVTIASVNGSGQVSEQSNQDQVTTGVPFSVGTNWAWNGQYGVSYNALQLEAVSGDGPYTWSVIQGALPRGLKLSADGIISGTPMGPSEGSTFTVQVTDASGQTASKALSIQVWGAPPLAIQTTSLPTGKMGKSYSAQLLADGGKPFQWSLVSGTLPTGVSLSPDGLLSGVPTESGDFSLTVQVSDGAGNPEHETVKLDIQPLPPGQALFNFNGTVQTIPVVMNHGLPYLPIWYLMQGLNTVGMQSHWLGREWYLNTTTQPYLYFLQPGLGTTSIYLNGVLVQNVTSELVIDPSTNQFTTLIPLWSLAGLLNRIGYRTSWDGTTWTVRKYTVTK